MCLFYKIFFIQSIIKKFRMKLFRKIFFKFRVKLNIENKNPRYIVIAGRQQVTANVYNGLRKYFIARSFISLST